ncbi:MAG: RND transporter [Gammaproteobacteria bacterium]|nr:MAG: RND transporter [Gammaproteobacteria bacterium]RLA52896.1 MAG: RND transporter [Gammaproteobacteria bacterium]
METARYRMARYVMHHQWVSLLILFAMTVFFAFGAMKTELKTIFSDLLPKSHPFVETYLDHPNFGNPLTVTVMVKRTDGGTIYNPETLQKVWDMTRNIDLTQGVDHDQILSISTEKARYAQATPFGIESEPLMGDHAPQTPEEMAEFVERVKKSPGSQNFLISKDGTATLIQATFIERLMDYGEIFQFVQENIVAAEEDDAHEIHVAGQPMLTGWVYFYEKQMLLIFAVTGVALLLSLVLYMRNIVGVVVPLVCSMVAALWGFGFVGWLGDPIEPLIMVVPLLLVARSFSHCVQFIERFYEIQYHVKDKKKAAEIAMSVMMAPGVLGIVTDAVGLFLIAIAPIPTMERFAVFCGFWALMLIPSGVFLTPLLLSIMPEPKNVKEIIGVDGSNTGVHGRIKHMLQRLSRISYGKPARITTVVVAVLFVLSIIKMMDLKIGNPVEGSNLLWSDSDYNVAVSKINSHFPGLNTLEIIFEVKEEEQERLLKQADTIFKMGALQRLVESDETPPVATLSFADYLPEANRLFSGGNPKWGPLDFNDQAVSAAGGAVLFGSSPKAFSHVTDFVQQNGTVSLWYKDNKQETVDVALAQVRSALDQIGIDHEKFRIRLGSGTIALQQSINDTVDKYQYIILLLLNIVILITCSWAYRSVVAGILLLIPVNMSNCFLAAVMVYMGIGLDVNTLPIAAIGIGVGIDYGIYLLSRICEEYQETEDYGLAILASVATTGKAIFFTATIVLLGILPWYFMSELKFLADMGLLLVMVMLINMVIALIVVPLLVWLIKPKFVASKDLLVGEGVDLSSYTGGDTAFD